MFALTVTYFIAIVASNIGKLGLHTRGVVYIYGGEFGYSIWSGGGFAVAVVTFRGYITREDSVTVVVRNK